jgi:fibronectin-binding autotransporter adhesin
MSKTISAVQSSEYVLFSSGNPLSITTSGGVETNGGTAIYGAATQAWTITNAGTVSGGSPASSLGIDLKAGGTIGNTGRISGAHYAIRIRGAAGMVTNAGSITSATDGVVLFAGGSVSNAVGGVITGTGNVGVYISGGAGTVTNSGTISGAPDAVQFVGAFADRMIIDPGAVFSGKVDGGNTIGAAAVSTLELASAASIGTLTGLGSKYVNFAQVTVDSGAQWVLSGSNAIVTGATLTNAGTLLDNGTLNGGGTLVNNGSISVAVAGGVSLSGGAITNSVHGTISAYNGIAVTGGGSVSNAGTIAGTGSDGYGVSLKGGSLTNQQSGTIEGIYTGVITNGGTVTNDGVIDGIGAIAEGVQALDGGLIVNAANATITAPNFIAVAIYSVPGTVSNAGVISGDGAGIILFDGGTVTNLSGGTITGGSFGVQGLNVASTVINAGTISAATAGDNAVSLAGGYKNRVVIDPGAVFSGVVNGGNGVGAAVVSTLELASAASIGTLTGLGSKYVNLAQVTVDTGAQWVLTGSNTIGAGVTLTLNSASLTATGTLVDNGSILLDPSTLTVGELTGTGTVSIGAGGMLTVEERVSGGQTIDFAGASGLLTLDTPRGDSGTIAGFVAGDTIDLVGVNQVTSTKIVNGNTLQVSLGNGMPIDLPMSGNFSGEFFHHATTGSNTDITVNTTPCFCRGTLIRTDRGEVPVEALAIGDRVVTLSGAARPIRWIGQRRFDLMRHPTPERVRPIRILADAFADGAPRRDLFVSPDHAVLRDGVLVPARLLLNGASVRRDTVCRSVAYYHIELDAHDILLAEDLAVESYLDTGNRGMFENAGGAMVLHPDLINDQARREAESCLPFAGDAARVEPIWRALVARAVRLGWQLPPAPETTDDPALHLLVDGRRVAPISVAPVSVTQAWRHTFIVPRADAAVRLMSRWAVPSEVCPWIGDNRSLGVMLSGLLVRIGAMVEPIPLDHPDLTEGWWQPEWNGKVTLRRWTNGDAEVRMLSAALAAPGPCLLEVEVAAAMPYSLPASVVHRRSTAIHGKAPVEPADRFAERSMAFPLATPKLSIAG